MKIVAADIFLQPYPPESEQRVKCHIQPNEQAWQWTRREMENGNREREQKEEKKCEED